MNEKCVPIWVVREFHRDFSTFCKSRGMIMGRTAEIWLRERMEKERGV